MAKRSQSRTDCPISVSLDIFGDAWSFLVIRDLFKGKSTYGEFLSSKENIATNILADRLRKLEACGIITKKMDRANRTRVVYAMTRKGRDLLPLLREMAAW